MRNPFPESNSELFNVCVSLSRKCMNFSQVGLLGGWRANALHFVTCAPVHAYLPLEDKQPLNLWTF